MEFKKENSYEEEEALDINNQPNSNIDYFSQKQESSPPIEIFAKYQCSKKNDYLSQNQQSFSPLEILTKIPQKNDNDLTLPLLSVIVTIFSGTSYDDLFRQVPQVAPGGRISLYSLNLAQISEFFPDLKNPEASKNEEIKLLAKEMQEVGPDAILFNFECCSGCSAMEYHFPQKEQTLELIKYLLDKSHMVMCSDFAVKALIEDWNEILGPNPFRKLGECSDFLELFFEPKTLEESSSKQLQMVAQLCQSGSTHIHALGSTVVFGVNKEKADNAEYNLSILTIVTKAGGFDTETQKEHGWTIGENHGTVGHAMLKYKSGGLMLLSAGHWIELSNLNTNIEDLEEVAMKNYAMDVECMNEIKEIKSLEREEERGERIQKMANRFVQQTAPCNYQSSSFQEKK